MKVWWRSELSQQSSVRGVQFCCQKCHCQHCPGGGREGGLQEALCCGEKGGAWCLPQTQQLISQAAQRSSAVWKFSESEQWPNQCRITTLRTKDDLTEPCPDNLSKLRTPVAQPLDKVIALPSGWTAAKGCSLSCTGAHCISAALSIFTQALLTAVNCLSYLLGRTGSRICFALLMCNF